jgi:hypothetical protein
MVNTKTCNRIGFLVLILPQRAPQAGGRENPTAFGALKS